MAVIHLQYQIKGVEGRHRKTPPSDRIQNATGFGAINKQVTSTPRSTNLHDPCAVNNFA